MRFGIVTPALCARRTFRACVASVRASAAFTPCVQARHIVVESDSSPDTCEDFAREAGCEFRRGPDSGIYDAISKGLAIAAGSGCEILSWLNADEQYLPRALGAAQRIFESNPDIGIVFGDYLIAGSDGVPAAARREIPARVFYLRHGVNYLLSCTVFFRRQVWEKSPGFDMSFKLLADKKFYLGALRSGVKAALCGEYLGVYGATGRNASLSPRALEEQARLRSESGAFASPLARRAVRALRIAEKAIHGCYLRDHVVADLFAPDGSPLHFEGKLGSRWSWCR